MKIAFAPIGGHDKWTGGRYYYRNLLSAQRSLDGDERPTTLLVHETERSQKANAGLQEWVDRELLFDGTSGGRSIPIVSRGMRYLRRRLGDPDPYGDFLSQHGVDCIFGLQQTRPRRGCAVLSWIPDFQHLHLPELFSDAERQARDRAHAETAARADLVILSSEDALGDFKRTHPAQAHKGRVLRFVAQLPEGVYDTDPSEVGTKYQLPERFFFLPNQFWRHKNHSRLFEAVALARREIPELTVVCTGNPSDYRAPFHFSDLLQQVSNLGIRENVVFLGLVPIPDLFQLMRRSLAVVQPSLFEGWSTIVEEVKSLGCPILLSDLPVHREQQPDQVRFFDPRSIDEMAATLVKAWKGFEPGPHGDMEKTARDRFPARVNEFARQFMAHAAEAVGSARGK